LKERDVLMGVAKGTVRRRATGKRQA